jgi:hypothetical protein
MNEKQASPEAIFKMKKEKCTKKFASASLEGVAEFWNILFGEKRPRKKLEKNMPGRQRLKNKEKNLKIEKKGRKKLRKKS